MKAAENMHIKGKVPKAGLIFGDSLTLEAVGTPACSGHQQVWWQSVAPQRQLATVAVILLSMPATAAMIERCDKALFFAKD